MKGVRAAAGLLMIASCAERAPTPPADLTVAGGDAARGRALVASGRFGCPACHEIPGIRGANGIAGPSLDGFAQRSFIAGELPNRPNALVPFLRNPPRLVADTAMPNVGLSGEQARDVAAFLYAQDERP